MANERTYLEKLKNLTVMQILSAAKLEDLIKRMSEDIEEYGVDYAAATVSLYFSYRLDQLKNDRLSMTEEERKIWQDLTESTRKTQGL